MDNNGNSGDSENSESPNNNDEIPNDEEIELTHEEDTEHEYEDDSSLVIEVEDEHAQSGELPSTGFDSANVMVSVLLIGWLVVVMLYIKKWGFR